MNIPENLKYTESHEWVRVEGNIATIGITDFAQGELGDVVFVDIPEKKDLAKDDVFGTIEAVKTVSDLLAPVSGTITEINEALAEGPEAVNTDPYGNGWMIKMEINDPSELDTLLDAEAYKNLIGAS